MVFCEKLRMLIEERGITQKQVAVDLSMAASTMGGYVQGNSEPDFDTLVRLADYFEVSTDYLLGHPSAGKSVSEDELLRVFRAMTPEQKHVFIEQGKVFIRANQSQNG